MLLVRALLCFGLIFVATETQLLETILNVAVNTLETVQNLLETLGATWTTIFELIETVTEPEILDEWKQNLTIPLILGYPLRCDFIIVGAGVGGSTLAGRLSEVFGWRVCLFEAGQPETIFHSSAAAYYFWFEDVVPGVEAYVYENHWAETQDGLCQGMENNQCKLHRGKCVGGGSCINGCVATRGNPSDYYDLMVSLGLTVWSYAKVLPYFKKLETPNVEINDGPAYRGTNGPLSIEDAGYRTKITDAMIEGMKCLGYEYIDHNGRSQFGTSYIQSITRNGRRHSSASAYLYPVAWKRSNLVIVTGVVVKRVLINPVTKVATGIEFVGRLGLTYRCSATKEVVVSGGAFGSPKILMLSGIGPRQHLAEVGIPLIADLPVGQALYDHPQFFFSIVQTNTTGESVSYSNIFLNANGETPAEKIPFVEWLTEGTGPLSLAATALGYINAERIKENQRDPAQCSVCTSSTPFQGVNKSTIEYFITQANPGIFPGNGAQTMLGIRDDVYQAVKDAVGDSKTDVFFVATLLLEQFSPPGYVQLRDSNYKSVLKVVLNFLRDERDVDLFLTGINELKCILQTPPFRAMNATLICPKWPGCESFEPCSDDYYRCAIKLLASTSWHYFSTCKMGTDNTAVVGSDLKVRGVGRLRVCDASVFPFAPSAHPTVPITMLAERAADFIKAEYGRL